MSSGHKLISEIVSNTGLPENTMAQELISLLGDVGLDSSVVTLEDLRQALAEYAQEVLLAAKDAYEQDVRGRASGE